MSEMTVGDMWETPTGKLALVTTALWFISILIVLTDLAITVTGALI